MAIFFNRASNGGSLFLNIASLFKQDPISATIIFLFVLIALAVFLFLLWLAVVSQVGLINNSAKIILSDGKKEKTTIKEGFEMGVKKFWQVLGFNLIGASLTCFFAVLVGLPLVFLTVESGISVFLLYMLLFVIFIPLALIVSFLIKYAICFSVIKKHKFVDSFVSAWRVFAKNWLVSLEMALILFMIDFLVVVVLGLILLILAIPFIFAARILSLIVFMAIGVGNFFQWAIMGGVIVSLIFVVLAGAAVTCFKTVAWTDIFVHLVDKKGGLAKLERMAAKLKK
jgi:hypothetical protein